MVKLSDIFEVSYGNKFDLNKMMLSSIYDADRINFVSRASKNLGVVAVVKKYHNTEPYHSGLITVALGGAILSSFVQQQPFYTAQNLVVLKPKKVMTLQEKIFYCMCIEKNAYKYSTFGREANRTIKNLEVPPNVPHWVNTVKQSETDFSKPALTKDIRLNGRKWVWFKYGDLFDIERGRGARKKDVVSNGKTPVITSIDKNNGLIGMTNNAPVHKGNAISVNRNGSIGEAFYQSVPFCSTEDVHIFNPKPQVKLNIYTAMFLICLIKKEQYRYNYGRKWGIARMQETKIMLPEARDNIPDWQFMEDYIKTLLYSKGLAET